MTKKHGKKTLDCLKDILEHPVPIHIATDLVDLAINAARTAIVNHRKKKVKKDENNEG